MPFQSSPRTLSVLASALGVAAMVLAVAGCGHVTPLGPGPTSPAMPPARQLGSPMIVQVMRSRPPTATGGCPAGWVGVVLPRGAPQMPCYRPAGTPVTITHAAVSAVATYPPPPGQPKGPSSYGFMVGVPAADVAAVTAVIRKAYDSRAAVGISVAGKLWEAPKVLSPFPGQQLGISLLSRTQAVQLYRLLVPSR
jgi:hypothetical protein